MVVVTAVDNNLRYNEAHRVRDGAHSIRVVRRDGSVIFDWPEASLESINWRLNEPGTASIGFPGNSERGKQLKLVDNEIQILRNGQLLWWGVPWRINGVWSMKVECEGLLSYFNSRYLTYTSLEYENLEQFSIAWNLLSHAQTQTAYSDLNITAFAWTPSGKTRYRLYRRDEHPNIMSLLSEFPELRDGFDYDIEYDIAGTRKWRPYFPSKGSYRPSQALIWGRNVIGIKSYSEDGLNMARQVYVTGGTAGDVRFEQNDIADGLNIDDVMLTAIISDGQTLDVDWLQDRVQEELANRSTPLYRQTLLVTNDPTSFLDGASVGDTVDVSVEYGRISILGEHRITSITYYPNQTCDVELEPAA